MEFKDSLTLDASGLNITNDGYLIGDAKVSRAGNVQSYYGSELGLTGEDASKVFGVYRDPDVVFNEKSMMSLAGRPVTRGHPPGGVSADSWKQLTVGQIGGVIRREGEHVVAPMAIMDSSAVKEVAAGARALSAGYTVEIVAHDGVAEDGTPYQFKQAGELRFNHVAYLPDNNPRAGNTRIGDSWVTPRVLDYDPGNSPSTRKGVSDMELKPVVLGDAVAQVAVGDIAAVEAYKVAMTKKLADAEAAKKAAEDKKDEEIGELKAKLKKAEDANIVDVDALVAARSALVAQVKAVDAAIEVAGKSDAELRKLAVKSKLGDAAIADASDAEISGMFKVLAAGAGKGNPVADAISTGVKPVGDQATAMQDAWQKANADMNAWRNQQGGAN